MTALLVLAGAMLGAPARYLADRWVQSWHESVLPWGTWAVNVVGSALLGLLTAATIAGTVPAWLMAGAGAGFCGALTTYSAFGYEMLRLVETGAWRHAVVYLTASLTAGLGAAFGVAAIATGLWG